MGRKGSELGWVEKEADALQLNNMPTPMENKVGEGACPEESIGAPAWEWFMASMH